MRNRGRWAGLVLLVILSCMAGVDSALAADKFPSREIIIVVPFPAGGPQDTGARLLAEYMNLTKELGMNVLVENRPEAGAVKGIMDVYKAPPDGHLLLSNLFPSFAQKEIVYKAPYKILELTYLAAFNKSDQFVVVSAQSPYKTIKDLIEASKKKSLNCGTSVVGSLSHLTALIVKKNVGINYEMVPFKGSGPNMMALLGGNVDLISVEDLTMTIQKDKVRPLGIAADKRSPDYPDVPTFKELGYAVPALNSLQGIAAPPKLPPDIARVLTSVLTKAINNPEFKKKVEKVGANPIFMNSAEYLATAKQSYALVDEYKEIFK